MDYIFPADPFSYYRTAISRELFSQVGKRYGSLIKFAVKNNLLPTELHSILLQFVEIHTTTCF